MTTSPSPTMRARSSRLPIGFSSLYTAPYSKRRCEKWPASLRPLAFEDVGKDGSFWKGRRADRFMILHHPEPPPAPDEPF